MAKSELNNYLHLFCLSKYYIDYYAYYILFVVNYVKGFLNTPLTTIAFIFGFTITLKRLKYYRNTECELINTQIEAAFYFGSLL